MNKKEMPSLITSQGEQTKQSKDNKDFFVNITSYNPAFEYCTESSTSAGWEQKYFCNGIRP